MSLQKRLFSLLAVLSLALISSATFARQLPPGNYWKSCSQCHYNRNSVLSCRCRTANGFKLDTFKGTPTLLLDSKTMATNYT